MPIYLGKDRVDAAALGQFPVQSLQQNLFDIDAVSFINATGISGATAGAINGLVVDLKSASLWDKMYVIYPLVGGTTNSVTYNLKNVTQWRGSLTGSWTIGADGITGNASNTAFNTTFFMTSSAQVVAFSGSQSIGVYVRNNSSTGYDMGVEKSGASNDIFIISRYINDNTYYSSGIPNLVVPNTNSQGFYVGTVLGTTRYLGKNGSVIATDVGIGQEVAEYGPILLGANRSVTINEYSNRQYAFSFIGKGLDTNDITNYYNIVQNFQTKLGRQV